MIIKPITPYDVDKMKPEDILDLVDDKAIFKDMLEKDETFKKLYHENKEKGIETKIPNKHARLTVVKIIYKILGYDLSADAALILVDRNRYQQVVAVAGAGKTSISQINTVMEKIMWNMIYKKPLYGNRVLCLVYGTNNVSDMERRHLQVVEKIRSSGAGGFNIDGEIKAQTVHSFCDSWLREYRVELGLMEAELLGDQEGLELLEDAFNIVAKKYNNPEFSKFISLKSLYDFHKDSLLAVDHIKMEDKVAEVGLPTDLIKDIFLAYDRLKKHRKRYDYIDQLLYVCELLETNEKARTRIQGYYDYVTADEIQDFTPLMHKITRLVVGNKGFLGMGDEDQTVFGFKGASVDSVLDFPDMYEGGRVYILNRNRRCPSEIIDIASLLITENKKRFEKKILPAKQGGTVELIPYTSEEEQVRAIVSYLKTLTPAEQEKVVVSYRNTQNSFRLTQALSDAKIPYNILSGKGVMDHELFGHVISVLDALQLPFKRSLSKNLYKVLPIYPKQLAELLGWDYNLKRFKTGLPMVHFKDIDYGKFAGYKVFSSQLEVLVKISVMMKTQPMKDYFPALFAMMRRYFWDHKAKTNDEKKGTGAVDEMFTERVFNFFNTHKHYSEVYKEYSDTIDEEERNNKRKVGVTLGTFHSLKGLEFDTQIMTFMDDAIFPNMEMEDRFSDEEEIIGVSESETRLAYVAVTRPKKNLIMYYNVDNPSYYVKRVLKYLEMKNASTVARPVEKETQIDKPVDITTLGVSTKSVQKVDVFQKSGYLKDLFKKL